MLRKNITGANYGLYSWLFQRGTAIVMFWISIFIIALLSYTIIHANGEINSWQEICKLMWVKVTLEIFFLAMILHAWIGVRDIWMDYVQNSNLRVVLHAFTIIWLVACVLFSFSVIGW